MSGRLIQNAGGDGTVTDNGDGTLSIHMPVDFTLENFTFQPGVRATLHFVREINGTGAVGGAAGGGRRDPRLGLALVSGPNATVTPVIVDSSPSPTRPGGDPPS
jgi:hypothetical protein